MKIKFSRFIPLILIISMLATPLAVFGEGEANVNANENTASANVTGLDEMNFLNSLKIVNYTEAKLSTNVTNIEFAGAASLIKGSTKNYYDEGLLEGLVATGDMLPTCKYPDRTITYMQAVKALVSVLGYDFDANDMGGYPNGYLSCASKLKITKGTENNAMSTPLTYGTLCILLYNCLDVERIAVTSYGEGGKVTAEKAGTVLNDIFEIYEESGRVTGNSVTSLSGNNVLNPEKIWIDSNVYSNANAEYDEYLGYNVNYWYKKNDFNQYDVLYMTKEKARNNVLTIDSDDSKYNKASNTYTYYQNDKKRTAQLDDGYCLLYNKRVSDKGLEEYADNIDGYITLVDTNSDGKYDFVEVVSYTTIFVSKINSYAKKIYDEFNTGKSVCFDSSVSESKYIFKDIDGNEIKFDDIKTYDVVSVIMSDDDMIATAIVSHEKAKATVDTMLNSNDKAKAYIASGGKKYSLSKSVLVHLNGIVLGEEYQLSIDFRGDVAGFIKNSSLFSAGMIMNVVDPVNAFNEREPKIMIYSTEGKKAEYNFAEKVTVDGTNYKKAGDAYDALYKVDENGQTVYKSDFIRYRVQNDAIVEIDTAYYDKENESEQSLHMIGATSNKTIHRDGQFFYTANGDGIVYDNAVTVFMAYLKEASRTDENNYKIITTSYLPSGYSVPNVTGYTTDLRCPDTKYIVIGMTSSFANQINAETLQTMCLESIGEKVVGDEILHCVRGWDLLKNSEVEVTVRNIDPVKDFNKGDLFSYSISIDGEFGTVYRAYDAKNDKVIFYDTEDETKRADEMGVNGTASKSGSGLKWTYGKPYVAANNYVYLIPYSKSADMSECSFLDCKMIAHKRRTPLYYVYDKENYSRLKNVLTPVEISELKDYVNTGDSADTVLALSYPSLYSAIIIFR